MHLIDVWNNQVHTTPDHVAVVYQQQHVTYAQLDQQANRLASYLQRHGIHSEQLVGLCISPSLEMVVAILGILKAGAAFVPLDPNYPKERLHLMMHNSQLDVIVSTVDDAKKLWHHGVDPSTTLFCLDAIQYDPFNVDEADIQVEIQDHHLACCIYTSGSTGQPKGVLIEHQALLGNCRTMQALCQYSADDCSWLSASLNYVSALEQLFMPLLRGGRVVVREDEFWDAKTFLSKVQDYGITVVDLLPSYWHGLLDVWQQHVMLPNDFPLRLVVLSGEAVQLDTVRLWRESLLSNVRCFNAYGMTETPVSVTCFDIPALGDLPTVPIGVATGNWHIDILDEQLHAVAGQEIGEICISGIHLARGYLHQAELTAEKFIINPKNGNRMYRTGDLGRFLANGTIEYIGRKDRQIQIRGFRVEMGEVEAVLLAHPAVKECAVIAQGVGNMQRLLASVVFEFELKSSIAELRQYLSKKLPPHMIPDFVVLPNKIPRTPNGKIDYPALSATTNNVSTGQHTQLYTETQQHIATLWQDVLQISEVNAQTNFFDAGGNSLLALVLVSKLQAVFINLDITITMLFAYPTIQQFAQHIDSQTGKYNLTNTATASTNPSICSGEHIAVIGMACRFPDADSPQAFWENLVAGKESITFFSKEELEAAGVTAALLDHPDYVKARPVLQGCEQFDAEFFSFTPNEAKKLDPQKRLFMTVVWEALEDAGCTPESANGSIGIYAGAGLSQYRPPFTDANDPLALSKLQDEIYFDKDYLASYVAYKLNLKGPALTIQTACSTSLVTVSMACQGLLSKQCGIAVAGGVSLQLPQTGYLCETGGIESPDGHCRAFDAAAEGTVFGSGVGAVALKRLDDALHDGDRIYAVIRGCALNNDGAQKSAFTAPSQAGQSEVIAMAQQNAGVEAESITYIETHGTGTRIGDPIELAALSDAFQKQTAKKQFCAIGSVKTNVGHLDSAAGIASFIKTVLALYHRQLPPSLHFNTANPAIDFLNSPFYVNNTLSDWQVSGKIPRRAGVSSFGIGGTNAHVILQEAPDTVTQNPTPLFIRPAHIFTLSAKSQLALAGQVEKYIAYFTTHPNINLADVCFTVNTGRLHFEYRLTIVAKDIQELATKLQAIDPAASSPAFHHVQKQKQKNKTAFLFTGQGAQYADMGKELYHSQPLFHAIMQQCDEILQPYLKCSLLTLLYGDDETQARDALLTETQYAQPALFALEYALAKLWQSWGVEPAVIIGHSVGEYAAACFAGVFSLADGLKLITARGRLMQALPADGMMVAVQTNKACVDPFIAPYSEHIAVAAFNASESIVLSGKIKSINTVVQQLQTNNIKCKTLDVSHAFHSPLMQPMLDEFASIARTIDYANNQVDFISNINGKLQANSMNADYWLKHIMQPVCFTQGMNRLHQMGVNVFIEIGPKPVLLNLAQQSLVQATESLWLPSLYSQQQSDWQQLLQSIAKFYCVGGKIDWHNFYQGFIRQKLALPTYPFQNQVYWLPKTPQLQSEGHVSIHPLLGPIMVLPTNSDIHFQKTFLSAELNASQQDGIDGCRLANNVYTEIILAALQQIDVGKAYRVHSEFGEPLLLIHSEEYILSVVFSPDGDDYLWQVFARRSDLTQWQSHAKGRATQAVKSLVAEHTQTLKTLIQSEVATIVGTVPDDDHDFFDLGMDSLMLTQLSNRLNAALQLSLPMHMLLNHHTVEKLTQQINIMQSIQQMECDDLDTQEDGYYEEGIL